ncbi:MAG: hypothetical protein EA364_08215 [Balneolaceae bacterium]|nr:MAG: hypothetical protein EA364_08215 [Balneolaceae bacterium]
MTTGIINIRKFIFYFLISFTLTSCNDLGEFKSSPQFPGDSNEFDLFLKEKARWVPPYDIEGIVILELKISEYGKIDSIRVINSLCQECDNEAIRIIGEVEKWIPARKFFINRPGSLLVAIPFGPGYIGIQND